ncbi:CARDB domain-containing protein [Gemmatimonadota bacterium]
MFRHSLATLFLVVTPLILLACGDQLTELPTDNSDLLQQGKVPVTPVCSQESSAEELIDCLFPAPGLRNAAQQRLRDIRRQFDGGQEKAATAMMFNLLDFTLKKQENGDLLEPLGLSPPEAISLLFNALFEAVGMDPPDIPEGALGEEGAAEIVSSAGGTVATGTEYFGVDFERKAFDGDVLVTLERLADWAEPGEGPLPTPYRQYGPFYRLKVSPKVEKIEGLKMGLCSFDAGDLAPPSNPVNRANLRIARNEPANPGSIKILELAAVPGYVDCDNVMELASVKRFNAQVFAGWVDDLAGFFFRAVGPTSLSATGLGAAPDTILMGADDGSTTGTVDESPDLIVESYTHSPLNATEADPITLSAVVKNIGATAAGASHLQFGGVPGVLPAQDVSVDPLEPNDSQTVTRIVNLGPGSYNNLLAIADVDDEVVEADENNNGNTQSFNVEDLVPASITIHGGDGQTGEVGTLLTSPVSALVKDQYNNPLDGVPVNFSVTAGGGSVAPTNPVTATGGLAQAQWTLGGSAGSGNHKVKATVNGYPALWVEFTASATPGPPTHLAFTEEPTSTQALAIITPPVEVTVRDAFGNTVPSATNVVAIAIGTGPGGTLSGTTSIVPVGGVATFGDLSLDVVGTYTLVATSASLAPATSSSFEITASPPQISVSPTHLEFWSYEGYNPAAESFEIRNTGGGTLTWGAGVVNVVGPPSCVGMVSPDPTSGSLGPGASETIWVEISGPCDVGTHTSDRVVYVSSNGGGAVTVTPIWEVEEAPPHIYGRVMHEGAGVPGWTVWLDHPGGGQTSAVTDAEGDFLFWDLTPGTYTVSISLYVQQVVDVVEGGYEVNFFVAPEPINSDDRQ